MNYSIEPTVHCECDGLNIHENRTFSVTIREDLQDVVSYLFYKKYRKPYSDLSWYLEDGAKEFVKSIEDSWNANTFDSFSLYHDRDFLEYLAKYWDGGFDEDTLSEILDELKEDIIEELESLNKVDIEYIIDNYGDNLYFSVDGLTDTIDLTEFIEDNEYLWEDD